jgi:hypothetical protein
MILNTERDALIKDLVVQLHEFARSEGDENARDLADCVAYMHKLWKAKVREKFRNGGQYDCTTW